MRRQRGVRNIVAFCDREEGGISYHKTYAIKKPELITTTVSKYFLPTLVNI